MKAKYIRSDMEAAAEAPDDICVVRTILRNGKDVDVRFIREGAIVSAPDVYRLVQMGVAEPADEECRQKAAMTPERMQAAQRAYDRLAAGIHPDDFERFDRGEILGYDIHGNDIPGPRWDEFNEDDDDDDVIDGGGFEGE